jgi:signal transduction histidine kinase
LENTGKFKTSLEEDAYFEINDDQGIILFRIIQELLNNIVKHARASKIIIRIERNKDQFSISVIDNGCGFDTVNILSKNEGGIGLQNISDRAKVIGAKISLLSQPQNGTTVTITF